MEKKKVNPDLTLAYRNVFTSYEGQMVLAHMLYELGVFRSDPDTNIDLKNYGARILEIIGNGRVDVATSTALIRGLCTQTRQETKT